MSDQRNESGDEDDPLLQELYRASGGDVPDPRLDARIREAAAAATARRSRWTRVRAGAAGAASAAVVVVAVTLVLGGDEPALRSEEPAQPAAVTAARRQPAAARREESAAPPLERRLFAERAGASAADMAAASRAADETAAEREEDGDAPQAAEAKLERLVTPARYGQQFAEPAPTAGIRVTDPTCAEPFPLPEGASIRILDNGLEVRLAGEVYRLTCSGGAWARQEMEPGP